MWKKVAVWVDLNTHSCKDLYDRLSCCVNNCTLIETRKQTLWHLLRPVLLITCCPFIHLPPSLHFLERVLNVILYLQIIPNVCHLSKKKRKNVNIWSSNWTCNNNVVMENKKYTLFLFFLLSLPWHCAVCFHKVTFPHCNALTKHECF